MTRDELLRLFKSEVDERAPDIDPDNKQDWYALTLGWALAKGMEPDAAHDFARFVRYNTELA